MRLMTPEYAKDSLRLAFTYNFMRPDQVASVPIWFPGVEYAPDGTLTESMQIAGTEHLIGVLAGNGSIIRSGSNADVAKALHHALWDRWTADEIGEGGFVGHLFDDHGRIYRGCTAINAANHTAERLAALGCELWSYTIGEDGPQ